MRAAGVVLALAAALLTAGCGTGGIAEGGDQDTGKTLFQSKCGGCHTLADAGSNGKQGPNLDDAFAYSRRQGFKDTTIEQVVRDQIELASCADPNDPRSCMPQNLVKGHDADDVAAYVASVAGKPGAARKPTSGKDIFVANCGSCHTLADAGTKGAVGPNLDDLKPQEPRVEEQVTNGGGGMPAFKDTLTKAQITAVAKYVAQATGR